MKTELSKLEQVALQMYCASLQLDLNRYSIEYSFEIATDFLHFSESNYNK